MSKKEKISPETAAMESFREMALIEPLQAALDEIGYETPSPIQARTIPYLLEGRDVLGQAQTGTGKTAAFALPLLSRIEVAARETQVMVLTPTRELAIQVAESFQRYAAEMPGLRALAVYGGQDYMTQIRALKRGAQVVVGTPGRVMDHLRRGTLKLDSLKAIVLDEADEMLNMGFLEDVEVIMEQTPPGRQVALFCATMPEPVRRIAQKYLNNPEEIRLMLRTNTVATLNQRYWLISGLNKLDTLSRILECETCDGILIFVRTKTGTVELVEQLQGRGFTAEALNGDMKQSQREHTVNRFKNGKLDILVATDVAARGLDVERISHVINYDIPTDTETYIHRVGRTGRAGRSGEAILFVSPRERYKLRAIEAATKQRITQMEIPDAEEINAVRIKRFKKSIGDAIEAGGAEIFAKLLKEYSEENGVELLSVAAALAKIIQGDRPFLLEKQDDKEYREPTEFPRMKRVGQPRGLDADFEPRRRIRKQPDASVKMESYRMEVGREHGVRAGNIVGAIANEANLDSAYIQKVKINSNYSTVDLPEGMSKEILRILSDAWVVNRQLKMSKIEPGGGAKSRVYKKKDRDEYKTGAKAAGKQFKKPGKKTDNTPAAGQGKYAKTTKRKDARKKKNEK